MTTKAAKTTNVTPIRPMPAKGDAELANNAGAAQRIEVLDNINTAEDLLGTALVEGLRMTVLYGPTSAQEVREHYTRCGSPDVYASWFNRGDKAQQVVGQKLALQAIDNAIAGGTGGPMFQRAREALAGIVQRAKAQGLKQLNSKQGALAVKESVAQAREGAVQRKAKKSTTSEMTTVTVRGTKRQDAATMATAALECGKGHREMAAFVKLASQNAHRLPAPVGREQAHRDALTALANASEQWAVFTR